MVRGRNHRYTKLVTLKPTTQQNVPVRDFTQNIGMMCNTRVCVTASVPSCCLTLFFFFLQSSQSMDALLGSG